VSSQIGPVFRAQKLRNSAPGLCPNKMHSREAEVIGVGAVEVGSRFVIDLEVLGNVEASGRG
jgi:hypothetical protein